MNFLQLRYFITVAETGHLSRSAEMLCISQPSLSTMIKKLEKELGVVLFKHTGRNIKLTESGEIYAKYVKEAFMTLQSGRQAIEDLQQKQKTVINIACTCPRFTYSVIKKVFPNMPHITIKQSAIHDEDIPEFLASRANSYVISAPHNFTDANISCKQIFEERLLLAVSQESHLAGLTSVKLEDLKNEPFIALNEGFTLRSICEELCRQVGFKPNNIMECDHISRMEAISNNYGVAISVCLSASPEYAMPASIKYIPISNPQCFRKIAIFKHNDKYYSGPAQEFAQRAIGAGQYLADVAKDTYENLCRKLGVSLPGS